MSFFWHCAWKDLSMHRAYALSNVQFPPLENRNSWKLEFNHHQGTQLPWMDQVSSRFFENFSNSNTDISPVAPHVFFHMPKAVTVDVFMVLSRRAWWWQPGWKVWLDFGIPEIQMDKRWKAATRPITDLWAPRHSAGLQTVRLSECKMIKLGWVFSSRV